MITIPGKRQSDKSPGRPIETRIIIDGDTYDHYTNAVYTDRKEAERLARKLRSEKNARCRIRKTKNRPEYGGGRAQYLFRVYYLVAKGDHKSKSKPSKDDKLAKKHKARNK